MAEFRAQARQESWRHDETCVRRADTKRVLYMRPATPPMTYIFIREDTSPQLVLAGRKAQIGRVHV